MLQEKLPSFAIGDGRLAAEELAGGALAGSTLLYVLQCLTHLPTHFMRHVVVRQGVGCMSFAASQLGGSGLEDVCRALAARHGWRQLRTNRCLLGEGERGSKVDLLKV